MDQSCASDACGEITSIGRMTAMGGMIDIKLKRQY